MAVYRLFQAMPSIGRTPLPVLIVPHTFGTNLSASKFLIAPSWPINKRGQEVSCYALFKGWLLLGLPPIIDIATFGFRLV